MNAREKWNAMINKIEEMVAVRTRDWREIANKACQCGCLPIENDKERNSIFRFMIGNTLEGYINERRDVCAYNYFLQLNEWRVNWDTVFGMTCVESQKALITRFNKTFGVTPTYVFKSKDESLINWK